MGIKKQIFGWSMYDFATTIFSALFITVYFPLMVVLVGGTAFHVGLVISLSFLFAAIITPFLGAIADITQRKKILLFAFTLISCIFTFLISFFNFFNLYVILILGFLALFFYTAIFDIYNAMIADVSNRKNMGWISGLGTAIGYLGTPLSIIIAFIVGKFYGYESFRGIQIMFMLTSLMFFGFSMFTFMFIKEPSKISIKREHFKQAFSRVISTIKNIKGFKNVWIYLAASILFSDGAETVITFLYLYGRDQIGLGILQFLPLYAAMAIAAAVGSLFFGKITDKLGHKKTLTYVLFLWIAVLLLLYAKTTYFTFIAVGMFGGALLGAIWTITRPLIIEISPKVKLAELMGWKGLTEDLSGVIGPVSFGYVATFIGFRQALWVIIALFLAGIVILRFV